MSTEFIYLVSNLAKFTPPIKPVMRDSLNNRLLRRSKETNTEFDKTLHIAFNELPGEDFNGGVLDSLKSYYLGRYIMQRDDFLQQLRQARTTSIAMLVLLIIGAFIMLAGVTLYFFAKPEPATIAVISGAMSEVLGFLILQFNKLLNDRLDETAKQMDTLARTQDAMTYIDLITDPTTKGEAIKDLLKNILNMKDVLSE